MGRVLVTRSTFAFRAASRRSPFGAIANTRYAQPSTGIATLRTGTPPGVGHGMKPPIYLKPGDIMETEISGIGVIRNEIRAV